MRYKMSMLAKRSTKTTSRRGRYVTDRKGKRTGVVISLKRYSRLMEDLHDLAVVAERRDEKPVTADDMKKRLHKRGLL
jgi:PHD/YefM family antitoxin component YafN of YafNO toxin-antitoxin module